jgi:predicted NBD/HSP70 family sugar kinase
MTAGPDLEGLRELIRACRIPVIAEGRFSQEWEVRAALQMGAAGVVVGGALNDPIKQTARFLRAARTPKTVAAFDIGGTWLRFGLFEHWKLVQAERAPLPADPLERLGWMRDRLDPTLERVGISSGGTVDPTTNKVIEAKPIIPNHVGTHFKFGDVPVVALNDGLATAWGHACHPNFAGRRVATLALGTGLGFGLVDRGRLLRGPRGQYPRLNDAPASQNKSFEDLLGGAALTDSPTDGQIAEARHAANAALDLIRSLYLPDEIVLCGGVGFAPWLDLNLPRSPFGADAGLYGAAALALWPPMD